MPVDCRARFVGVPVSSGTGSPRDVKMKISRSFRITVMPALLPIILLAAVVVMAGCYSPETSGTTVGDPGLYPGPDIRRRLRLYRQDRRHGHPAPVRACRQVFRGSCGGGERREAATDTSIRRAPGSSCPSSWPRVPSPTVWRWSCTRRGSSAISTRPAKKSSSATRSTGSPSPKAWRSFWWMVTTATSTPGKDGNQARVSLRRSPSPRAWPAPRRARAVRPLRLHRQDGSLGSAAPV